MTHMFKPAVVAFLLWPVMALAWSSGSVSGKLLFFQNQGNFCPTTRNCVGAKYVESQFHTNMPLAQTKVYIKNLSNQTIGQGVTDLNGTFALNWYDPSAPNGSAVTAYVVWQAEHKDGRFTIYQANGQFFFFMGQLAGLAFGTSTNMGTFVFGNSNFPNSVANLYDGAWRSWYHSLSQSNAQLTYNVNVDIRAFDSATCPTSCANCSNNRIVMDANSPFAPQGRILHEMGHIASCRASQGQGFNSPGCYHLNDPGNTWSLTSAEYGSATFEEAFATFFGDVALYGSNSTQPHTCLSASACPTGVFNVESSTGVLCSFQEERWPLSNIRYLWDLYDTNNDFSGESANYTMQQITQAVGYLPDGYDNRGKNEPWFGGTVDDCDGRSSMDYWAIWWTSGGVYTEPILNNNCGAVGD